MIENVVDKLMEMEKRLSAEKGEFSLFALLLREEAVDRWDLVASAKWLDADKYGGMRLLGEELKADLNSKELLLLSRVVVIEESDPRLEPFWRGFAAKHGRVELVNCELFGFQIRHGYVITSQRANQAGKAEAGTRS